MTFTSLVVESKEQVVSLTDGYVADIKFDPFYKRWYYNLYANAVMVAAGITLTPDSAGLLNIRPVSLGIIDRAESGTTYEAYDELGGILDLVEIQE